jgi:hypothetical protein
MSDYHNKFSFYLPWGETSKWVKDKWYPLPTGNDYEEGEGFDHGIPSHWNIFSLDDEAKNGDITLPVDMNLTFYDALSICKAHNGFKFERQKDLE